MPNFQNLETELLAFKDFIPNKVGSSMVRFPNFVFVVVDGKIGDQAYWLYFFGTLDGRWIFAERHLVESYH